MTVREYHQPVIIMTHASALSSAAVNIRAAVPTFLVPDVAQTAEWYAAHLGFRLAGAVPKQEPYVFASIVRDPIEIMLLALADYQKPDLRDRRPSGLWDVYIRVDGVHLLYETLQGESFVQTPLNQRSYGDWEFEVRDPNGYLLVFGGGY
jgi:catechol 2,3-dioxygenase-like lactoylglutathione lyase family enzyme